MTYNKEIISEQIPLYVDGNLSEKEQLEFEELLNNYPEIGEEIEAYMAMEEMYSEMSEQLPEPSAELFQKIEQRIFSKESESSQLTIVDKIQDFFKSILPSPQIGWGLAAVQAIAIVFMLTTGIPTSDQSLRTLSNSESSQQDGKRINIVFDKSAMEGDIRKLLLKHGATIMSGPTSEGLYILSSQSDMDMDTLLDLLREKTIVLFAEKVQ